MKRKTGKMILLTGVLCILSLAVCACGKKEEASDTPEPQVVQGEPIPEDDTEDDASASEPEADAEGTDTGNEPESPEASPEPQSGESSSQGTDSTQKEQPEAQSQSTSGTSAEWVDSTPNLEGDIKELKDGQLTVVEAITEKSDNGGDIVVSPGSEDDSEFNKIAVTYDEKSCLLYKRSTMEGPDLYCKSDLNHCLPSFDKEKALVRRVKNTTVPAVLVEMGYFSNY